MPIPTGTFHFLNKKLLLCVLTHTHICARVFCHVIDLPPSGQSLVTVGLVTCALGWNKLHGSAPAMQYGFAAAVGTIGLLVVAYHPSAGKRVESVAGKLS